MKIIESISLPTLEIFLKELSEKASLTGNKTNFAKIQKHTTEEKWFFEYALRIISEEKQEEIERLVNNTALAVYCIEAEYVGLVQQGYYPEEEGEVEEIINPI